MFTVHTPREALEELRAGWAAAPNSAFAAQLFALCDLRHRLKESPLGLGESRGSGHRRVAFGRGVAVAFEVYPERGLVRILRAWSFRRGR
jgi:hypothetical protein